MELWWFALPLPCPFLHVGRWLLSDPLVTRQGWPSWQSHHQCEVNASAPRRMEVLDPASRGGSHRG